MLYTPALMLITVWLLGLLDGCTMGRFIYLLPVVAVVLVLLNFRWEARRA
jgi:ABC-type Fe3+-siderophore transport system permease subunit